jgi:hypothetical protein
MEDNDVLKRENDRIRNILMTYMETHFMNATQRVQLNYESLAELGPSRKVSDHFQRNYEYPIVAKDAFMGAGVGTGVHTCEAVTKIPDNVVIKVEPKVQEKKVEKRFIEPLCNINCNTVQETAGALDKLLEQPIVNDASICKFSADTEKVLASVTLSNEADKVSVYDDKESLQEIVCGEDGEVEEDGEVVEEEAADDEEEEAVAEEDEEVVEEEEEVVEEDEEVVEEEEEAVAEEEEEVVEEEEEENVEEMEIQGVLYFVTGTVNGSKVYERKSEDDVGDLLGTLQDGLLVK